MKTGSQANWIDALVAEGHEQNIASAIATSREGMLEEEYLLEYRKFNGEHE